MLFDDFDLNVDATHSSSQAALKLNMEQIDQYLTTHPGVEALTIYNDPNSPALEIFLELSSTKIGTELEFLSKIRLEGHQDVKLKIISKFAKVLYTEDQFENFSDIKQEQKKELSIVDQENLLSSFDRFSLRPSSDKSKIIVAKLRLFSDISFIPHEKLFALEECCTNLAKPEDVREAASKILLELSTKDTNITKWFRDNLESFDSGSVLATAIAAISKTPEYCEQKRGFVEHILINEKDTASLPLLANSLLCLSKTITSAHPLDPNILESLPDLMKKGDTNILLHASKLLAISARDTHFLEDVSMLAPLITRITHSKVLENLFDSIKEKVSSLDTSVHKAIETSFTHLSSEGKQKYVDIVKKFVSDIYVFEEGTIEALEESVISEKKDAIRKGLSDLLFDIASNSPDSKCLVGIKDFFASSLNDPGLSDNVSTKIIVHELSRIVHHFHESLDISALRKLGEIAVDKFRSIDLCMDAIDLLKSSLIHSKEIPALPYVEELAEFYDHHDAMAGMLLDYLALRFLHGIDDIWKFKEGLDRLQRWSGFAGSLLSSNSIKNFDAQHPEEAFELVIHVLAHGNYAPLIDRFADSLQYSKYSNFERELDIIKILLASGAELTGKVFEGIVDILKSGKANASSQYLQTIIGKSLGILMLAIEKNHFLPYDAVKNAIDGLDQHYKDLYPDNQTILKHLIAQNAFFSPQEHDPEKLFDPLGPLEVHNMQPGVSFFKQKDKLVELKKMHDSVLEIFEHSSELFPDACAIKDWNKEQVGEWSNQIMTLKLKDQDPVEIDKHLPEILAVMMRANEIDTGNSLRSVQIAAILSLMTAHNKGLILQISTGEGKSTITAISAAIKALQGRTVDVITSSSVLAQRDIEERAEFFKMLGISASFNPSLNSKNSKINASNLEAHKRNAYGCQIVYGDVGSFQGDLVKDRLNGGNIRSGRLFEDVIVDEVDSMLIDEKDKSTLIPSRIAGMEYLESVFAAIWHHAAHMENQIVGNQFVEGEFTQENGTVTLKDPTKGHIHTVPDIDNFRKEHLKEITAHILKNSIKIPMHLSRFVEQQSEIWADSVLTALRMKNATNYILGPNNMGEMVVAPVDYTNTGIINTAMTWSGGVHQFLQLAHKLKLSPETFLTSYISNLTFFKIYGANIYGMTGTLGSLACREMLSDLYNIDLGLIPTYKIKDFTPYPSRVVTSTETIYSEEAWHTAVVDSIDRETSAGRPVLVICETIQKVKDIKEALLQKCPNLADKIRIYSRTDNDEAGATAKCVDSGEVIIATNLAGRGTDFKLTLSALKAKGLHVCLTFLPNNLRIEEQAFGRAARSGQPGSGELITSEDDISNRLVMAHNLTRSFDAVASFRDEKEAASLKEARLYGISALEVRDKLFDEFCELYKTLLAQDNNKNKLAQVVENWGLALNEIVAKIKPSHSSDLKDKVRSLGLKIQPGGSKTDSLYQALSFKVGGEKSPNELKYAILGYLSEVGLASENMAPSDDMIMQNFARLLNCNIVIITEKGYQVFKVAGAADILPLAHNDPLIRNIGGKDFEIAPGKYYAISKPEKGYPQEIIDALNAASEQLEPFSGAEAGRIFSLSKNPENATKIAKISAYIEKIQKDISENHKENTQTIALSLFEKFTIDVTKAFKDGHNILKNPAHLISEAFDRANNYSYAAALDVLDSAIRDDVYFNAAAYYNQAYFLMRQQGTDYKNKARVALYNCINGIQNFLIPQIEVVYLCEGAESGSDLSKQIRGKINVLKQMQASAQNLINQIEDVLQHRSAKELDVGKTKFIKDCVTPGELSDSDIYEFANFGFKQVFELEERLPESSFWGSFITGFVGCAQILASVCLGLTGVGIPAAISFFKAGMQDIVDSYKIACGEKAFHLGDYISSKGTELFCQLALSAAISIASAGKGLIEGAKIWGRSVLDTTQKAWGIGMQLVGLESAYSAAGGALQVAGSLSGSMGANTLSSVATETATASGYTAFTSVTQEGMKQFAEKLVTDVVIHTGLKAAVSMGIERYQKDLVESASNHLKTELDDYFGPNENRLIGILLADKLYLQTKVFDQIFENTMSLAQKENHMISSAVSNFASIVEGAASTSTNTGSEFIEEIATTAKVVALPLEATSQIENFVGHVGRACMTACEGLSEFSLRGMLKYKLKDASPEELGEIMSMLQIKGYLHDNFELNISATKEKFAENTAARGLQVPVVLEGSVERFNSRIVVAIEELAKAYDREVERCHAEFDHLKTAIAKSAQSIIYAKIRGEILMPLADKPLGMLAAGVMEKMQATLARNSKGGVLTDLLVGEKERQMVRDADEAARAKLGIGVSSGSDDIDSKSLETQRFTQDELDLIDKLEELKLSVEEAQKIDEVAKELASRFDALSAENNDEESFLKSATALASEYGRGVLSAALLTAQFLPPLAGSARLVSFLNKADNAATILGYLGHLKGLPWGESVARSQLGDLDWDPTNEQERNLSLNPLLSAGPKSKFGEVDSEALTLDVLAVSSMLIKGALGKKLHLAKIGAKGYKKSQVSHTEEIADIDKSKDSGILKKDGVKKVQPEGVDYVEQGAPQTHGELYYDRQQLLNAQHETHGFKHLKARKGVDVPELLKTSKPGTDAQFTYEVKKNIVQNEQMWAENAIKKGEVFQGGGNSFVTFFKMDGYAGVSGEEKTRWVMTRYSQNGGVFVRHSQPVDVSEVQKHIKGATK